VKEPKDQGSRDPRPWITIATAFVTMVVIYGIWYSYSVFLVALVRQFGWNRSLVAGAFSLFVLVHGALGPSSGGWRVDLAHAGSFSWVPWSWEPV